MRPHAMQLVMWTVALALPLLLVAGCPVQSSPLDTLDGTYWVEYVKGELVVYELPEDGGADAQWYALATEQPEWFAGPGLYETGLDNTWTPVNAPATLTLDEFLQTYDPQPRPVDAETESAGEQLAGLYWVECADGELSLYRFPKYTDEEGQWRTLEAEQPAWYVEAGLYEADEYFQWQPVSLEADLTLDDILQLYDTGPRPPG